MHKTGRIERCSEYFLSYLPDKETGYKIHGNTLVDGNSITAQM